MWHIQEEQEGDAKIHSEISKGTGRIQADRQMTHRWTEEKCAC
jgi:hypothetical protein